MTVSLTIDVSLLDCLDDLGDIMEQCFFHKFYHALYIYIYIYIDIYQYVVIVDHIIVQESSKIRLLLGRPLPAHTLHPQVFLEHEYCVFVNIVIRGSGNNKFGHGVTRPVHTFTLHPKW